MATQSDGTPLANLRLEELIHVLDIHNTESKNKHDRLKEKLLSLKERQDELQQRRVLRLRKEGFYIDLESVKNETKAAAGDKWPDTETKNEKRRDKIKEKLKELLHNENAITEEETDSEYESETEFENDSEKEDQIRKGRTHSRSSLKDLSKLDLIAEEDALPDEGNTYGAKIKTVQLKVKKNSRRAIKTVGHIVSSTKFMSRKDKSQKKLTD